MQSISQHHADAIKAFQIKCKQRMAIIRQLPPFSHSKMELDYKSIFTFSSFADRARNDANNRTREPLISAVINGAVPQGYQYSIVWRKFTQRLMEFLSNLFSTNQHTPTGYTCRIMAGRNHNYDFLVTATYSGGIPPVSKKVEFKFNARRITGCPQFLSVSSKANTTYAEYFYDNCVERITTLYGINTAISRNDYLKTVHQTNYLKHEWFNTIYQLENEGDEKHKEKKRIVDDSIHTYLTDHYLADVDNLEEAIQFWNNKFRETQGDKIYMLYCPTEKKFYRDEITNRELTISAEHMGIQMGRANNVHTLVFYTGENGNTSIKLLLRWRNHAGVLNPAWQISIHR